MYLPNKSVSQHSFLVTGILLVSLLVAFSSDALGQTLAGDGRFDAFSTNSVCDVYLESNGLIVLETESASLAGSWTLENGLAGSTGTGYYEWKTGNPSMGIDGSGQGVLSYPIEITQAGTYRFLFRTAAPHQTEHNDSWVRFPDNDVEARKSNGGSVIDLGQNTWFKVYQNKGGDSWNFVAHTVDNNAHQIFALIDSPGVYRLQMSGRSTQFKVDRLVLFNENVSEATATDLGTGESGCSSLPVELTSFNAVADGNEVTLAWTTASELNNAGFDIEFATAPDGDFNTIGFVAGSGTSTESIDYRYNHSITGFAGQTVYYRLKQLDFDGTFDYSEVVAVTVSSATTAMLHQAYPNPFNPVTTIAFTLPVEGKVSLTVYDAMGRLVESLVEGIRPAGYHSEPFQATEKMASGTYMYRLVTPSQTLSGTVMLLK